jgi:phasin family protein
MHPFSQSATPVVRTHLDAQGLFMNEIANAMIRSFQQMCGLNMQLVQTLLQETTTASQQMLTAGRQGDAMSTAVSRAQPLTDKLRAYGQHISRLAADTQVDLVRATEQHVQNTTRLAHAARRSGA